MTEFQESCFSIHANAKRFNHHINHNKAHLHADQYTSYEIIFNKTFGQVQDICEGLMAFYNISQRL